MEDFKRKLANVRTGRATIGLLDAVHVDYYGTPTPLNQMASIAVPEPQLITVQPWDMSQLGAVEKAIIGANLGLNPSNDGKVINLTDGDASSAIAFRPWVATSALWIESPVTTAIPSSVSTATAMVPVRSNQMPPVGPAAPHRQSCTMMVPAPESATGRRP